MWIEIEAIRFRPKIQKEKVCFNKRKPKQRLTSSRCIWCNPKIPNQIDNLSISITTESDDHMKFTFWRQNTKTKCWTEKLVRNRWKHLNEKKTIVRIENRETFLSDRHQCEPKQLTCYICFEWSGTFIWSNWQSSKDDTNIVKNWTKCEFDKSKWTRVFEWANTIETFWGVKELIKQVKEEETDKRQLWTKLKTVAVNGKQTVKTHNKQINKTVSVRNRSAKLIN